VRVAGPFTVKSLRTRGAIAVVIAHRLSALATVDLILVMKDGEPAAFGSKEDVFRAVARRERPMTHTIRCIRRNLTAALAVALVMGGAAAGWSAYARPEGAVVAAGSVVVESNLRRAQHSTGGIVSALNAREGQTVEAGDVLVRLDDTVTRANLGIVLNELTALSARLSRLKAEGDGGEPTLPADLEQRAGAEPDIARVFEGERALFRARATTRSGQKQQLGERAKQLREETADPNAQMEALNKQLAIARDELKDLGDLHARGLAHRPRITSLQREILGKEACGPSCPRSCADAAG
jgi:HlyD family secretion protein